MLLQLWHPSKKAEWIFDSVLAAVIDRSHSVTMAGFHIHSVRSQRSLLFKVVDVFMRMACFQHSENVCAIGLKNMRSYDTFYPAVPYGQLVKVTTKTQKAM